MSLDPQVEFAHDQDDMVVHMPFLERLAAQSRVIVEIGAGHGNGSTRAFVRGLMQSPYEEKQMISVDNDPERPQLKPTQSWWRVVHGDSRDSNIAFGVGLIIGTHIPQCHADVIFIDTVHTPDYMERELQVWSPLANEETVWVFHDTHMFGVPNAMVEPILRFCSVHDWRFIDLTKESHGLGLMVHSTNKGEFTWP